MTTNDRTDYSNLANQLDSIAEQLDEIMFEDLRQASSAKSGRPVDDKRLTQARRAIEKATKLLRGDQNELQ